MESFKDWVNSQQGRRDSDYNEYKELVGQRLVDAVIKRMPHLKERIESVNFGTPLSNMHYLNSAHGESLGIRFNPYRLSNNAMDFCRPETPIEGLYMTGQVWTEVL